MRHIYTLLLTSLATCAFANSPYISKVLEYRPAPGQYINTLPEIVASDSQTAVNSKVLAQIGNEKSPGMISLGAFGGYVVFGFDHSIVNVQGQYDFKIYGNAIISDRESNGGSCEPGIVLVSSDVNKNGIADDPWYELAGSEYYKETTKKNYTIKYFKPSSSHSPTPDENNQALIDTTYIRWEASDGTSGYITKNSFHSQSYWPEWLNSDTLEFTGTNIANNSKDLSGNGSYYILYMLDWGYVDNKPNNSEDFRGFDISWAVDKDGNKVNLSSIDFIKVHTAINKCNGAIGENSTEITGAEDLHPNVDASVDMVTTCDDEDETLYDIYGRRVRYPVKGTIYIKGGRKIIYK